MKYINKLDMYLRCLSTAKFILIMVFISYVAVTLLNLLVLMMNLDVNGPDAKKIPLVLLFLLAVIIAPILETFVYQFLIIRLLKKLNFFKNRMLLQVLISAVFFSTAHTYSIYYVFIAFVVGFSLAYAFVIYEDKKASAFWVTMAIHGLINGVSVVKTTVELLIISYTSIFIDWKYNICSVIMKE